jgi:LmbE family N-acetylglucosaminyl deacetylase
MRAWHRGTWAVLAALVCALASGLFAAEAPKTDDGKVRIVVFGAHPDDAEIRAGGTGALWAAQGHHVELVSVTNGDIGHSRMHGQELAARRTAEAKNASKILGTTSRVLDIHDGELEPTLENRRAMTRVIREWKADIVIGHRPNDYHPDHRYVGVLMQDSAYMVTVPFFCPETPHLSGNPVFLYSQDGFERPNPFRPDVVVAVDDVIDKKVEALVSMESQFVEGGANGPYPKSDAERKQRKEQSAQWFRKRCEDTANKYRQKLVELYGEEQGKKVRYAEAFEICEYGRRPGADELRKLFPFFPAK